MKTWFAGAALVAVVGLGAGFAQAEEKYTLTVSSDPTEIASGGKGTYKITITPAKGFVMKVETPFKAQLSGSDGLAIEKSTFSSQDFEDPKAEAKTVKTAFTAKKKGAAEISAELSFFICNDQLCERFKANPKLAVQVK